MITTNKKVFKTEFDVEKKLTELVRLVKALKQSDLGNDMCVTVKEIQQHIQEGLCKKFYVDERRSFQQALGLLFELEYLVAFSDGYIHTSDKEFKQLDQVMSDIKEYVWITYQTF